MADEHDTSQRLLTRSEVAKRTGLSKDQVRRLTESGDLPARKIGRQVLVTPEGLKRWLTNPKLDTYGKDFKAQRAQHIQKAS